MTVHWQDGRTPGRCTVVYGDVFSLYLVSSDSSYRGLVVLVMSNRADMAKP